MTSIAQDTAWDISKNNYNNLVKKTIELKLSATTDTLSIDTLSIDPVSFSIAELDSSYYTLLAAQGKIIWKKRPEINAITVYYRKLAINFQQPYYHKKLLAVDSNIAFPIFSLSGKNYTDFKGFVDFNALDYQGAYSRSLSIGNSQDVGMNSNFNLQLNGYIMDSIRIEAAITDNTIPFQPDGNTYQVQEFDRLFITFEKGKNKITAGDFNIATPQNSYFLQFNKRVQGLWLQTEQNITNNITNKTSFNGSIAKGQFARNIFNAQEGNQGPYKLMGNNGEQFFIVLAGTERVFIDGVLLQRGEDRDYVINYNTAEIKFMPRQMITKDKRIQVEFEYQDRNYLNSLFHLSNETQIGKKWNMRINAYTNQDAKNQPYMANFSDEQKQFLGTIGDDISNAFYKSMSLDSGSANLIRYRLASIDTNGSTYDSVFVYSNNTDSLLYNVNFSHVGENRGNYIISSLNTNGRSYQWIPPINGVPQGQYEPVILLITPKKHQIFSVGNTYQFDTNKVLNVEWSASNYDPNLYATQKSVNHWGQALKVNYIDARYLGKADSLGTKKWRWHNQINYELVTQNYKAIAPYRNIEFNRDWSVDSSQKNQEEHLVTFETGVSVQQHYKAIYNFTYYKKGSLFNAYRHIISLDGQYKNIKTNLTFNNMESEGMFTHTQYFRPKGFIEKRFPKLLNLTLGTSYELEDQQAKNKLTSLLNPNAFKFDVWSVYLKNDESNATRIQLKYYTRADYAIDSTLFALDNSSQNIEGKLGFYHWDNHQVSLTGGYRNLNIHRPGMSNLKPENSVVTRLEYQGSAWKRLLTTTLMYEIGTGQEQKREYAYLEVDAGMGMYMWVDYNGDNIQQANEFELAIYNDQKKYIRTLMMTNEYVKVDYSSLNFSFQLQPENLWGARQKGWKDIASRFSNQLSLQLNNRLVNGLGLKAFNVFDQDVEDIHVIQQSQNIINTLFFNRSSTKIGAEYIFTKNVNKSLLTYGLESNNNTQNIGRLRWGTTKSITTTLKGLLGNRGYQSGVNDGRTYDIDIYGLEPSIIAMFNSRLRITASYNHENRQNIELYGGEVAKVNSLILDTRWSLKQSGVVQAKFTYTDIRYSGANNTSIAFTMLDALSNGKNLLWALSWDTKLSKGIELSLEYEGRKPGVNPLVHMGRMSIRALL